jgi:aryl-alcohol dehydrogenase-like predicted oxidoreductase
MRYRVLGPSGIRVGELAVGTMTFGTAWEWGADRAECGRMPEAFVDAGGNLVDTACNYTDGDFETIVGELLEGRRDRFVVATKYTLTLDRSDPNAGGNHSKSLRRAVEQSLRRLRTDYIDLLWLHMWDRTAAIENVMYALDVQVRAGKVLEVGFSDTPAWVVAEAIRVAERYGLCRPVAVQAPYNAAWRDIERELLPMAAAHNLAALTWDALGGGVLTGKYRPGNKEPRRYGDSPVSARQANVAQVVRELAGQAGATPAQVSLAWVLSRRTEGWNLIPLLGARSETQLRDNLGALNVQLGPEARRRLDEAAGFELGFPRSFLEDEEMLDLIHAEFRHVLDF